MPFKSQAQRRWMYANHPEMAKRWQAHTPESKKLPEKVKKEKAAMEHRGLRGLFKQADISELLLSGGVGAGLGAAASPIAMLTQSRMQRRGSLGAGLRGEERGKLRRAFEHLADPMAASSYYRGKALREEVGGGRKAEELAQKFEGAEKGKLLDPASRLLALAGSPLSLLLAPLIAPSNAIMRMLGSKAYTAGRAGISPAAMTLGAGAAGGALSGIGGPMAPFAMVPQQAYLGRQVREMMGEG